MLHTILTIVFIVVCVVMTIVVLCQEGKDAGFGAASFTGVADSYWQKNKGRSKAGALEKSTKFLGFAFLALALVLQLNL